MLVTAEHLTEHRVLLSLRLCGCHRSHIHEASFAGPVGGHMRQF